MEYQTDPESYFTNDMVQEFHVAIARREASKILKRVDYHKKAFFLEKHLDTHQNQYRNYSPEKTMTAGS